MTDPTLILLLSRLGRLNEAFLVEVCARERTTPAEFRVLAMLRHHRDGEPVSPTHIAEWIVQTSGGLTATLGRLEQRGWISRETAAGDRRSRLVALTSDGRAFHDALFGEMLRRYDRVLEGTDHDQVLAMIRTLVAGFETAEGLTPTGSWQAKVEVAT